MITDTSIRPTHYRFFNPDDDSEVELNNEQVRDALAHLVAAAERVLIYDVLREATAWGSIPPCSMIKDASDEAIKKLNDLVNPLRRGMEPKL